MSRDEFLRRLRLALKTPPQAEVDEILADYAAHFDEAAANDRSEDATAAALGDPVLLARDHCADSHYYNWEYERSALSLARWLLTVLGLIALIPIAGVLMAGLPLVAIGIAIATAVAMIQGQWLLAATMSTVTVLAAAGLVGVVSIKIRSRYGGPDDGLVIERELNWSPGSTMTISIPAVVHWRPAEKVRAVARCSSGLADGIRLESEQLRGRLNLRPFRRQTIVVQLESHAIESWRLLGSGDLHLHDVDQATLRLKVKGSGDITATGVAESVFATVDGTGDIDVGQLRHTRATVNMIGNGDTTVAPSSEADLTIVGSGDIKVLTNPPKVIKTITGSGDITMAGAMRL